MSGRSSRATDRSSGQSARVVAAAILTGIALLSAGAGASGCNAPGPSGRKGEPLRVAAAADLALAFKEIGEGFEKASGKTLTFTFGSTGLLAKQIEQGAPFDVFAAANLSFVDDVVRDGACFGDTKKLYARGRIVMWSPAGAALPAKLEELSDPKYAKVAFANPEHAPYGRAAEQALTKTRQWETVKPRAVYGENVQQALMFAQSGNADVAIVALSLAISSGGTYVPIAEELHEPLDQALVICKGGGAGSRGKPNEARAFIEYVGSEAGRVIMRRYGFLLPGESLPAPTVESK